MDLIFLTKVLSSMIYPLNIFLALCFITLFINHYKIKKIVLFFAFSILLISSNPFFAQTFFKNMERQYPVYNANEVSKLPSADVIIVLGGGLGIPLPPRNEPLFTNDSIRFVYAKQLYNAGVADKILITGGNVFKQNDIIESEAFYTKQVLMNFGVGEADILIEEESRNTYQNALYTKTIMDKYAFKSAVLVTSAYHMARSYYVFQSVFEKTDITIKPMPTDYSIADSSGPKLFLFIPNTNALMMTNVAIKELVGIWVYRIKDIMSDKKNPK